MTGSYVRLVFLLVQLFIGEVVNETHNSTSFFWNTHDPVPTNWFIEKHQLRNYGHLLRNKRIVFVGDSLTRYQYLNLVNFFHTNSWHKNVHPSLEVEGEWRSWKSFHLGGFLRFGCEEICDCYRDNAENGPWKENRHYYNVWLNLSIDVYLWLPEKNIRGNSAPNASEYHKLCSDWRSYLNYLSEYSPESEYTYNILDFFDKELKKLKPDVLVVNQGFWSLPSLRDTADTTYMKKFVSLAKGVSSRVVWKTTTSRCGINDTGIDTPTFRDSLRSLGVEIFDAFMITKDVAKLNSNVLRVCWDTLHYYPFVYRELNKMFLDFIV